MIVVWIEFFGLIVVLTSCTELSFRELPGAVSMRPLPEMQQFPKTRRKCWTHHTVLYDLGASERSFESHLLNQSAEHALPGSQSAPDVFTASCLGATSPEPAGRLLGFGSSADSHQLRIQSRLSPTKPRLPDINANQRAKGTSFPVAPTFESAPPSPARVDAM